MASMPTDPPPPTDGRAARAQRTRAAIVEAMLALIEEGDLQPSAARIAERAGISDRLIYHHFDDMEALLGAVGRRQSERVLERARPIDPGLPRARRIARIVDQRADIYELITPVRRAALLQEPFSPELRATRDRMVEVGRREIERVFAPELAGRTPHDRRELHAALDVVLTWSTWDELRTADHTPASAKRVLRRVLTALLD